MAYRVQYDRDMKKKYPKKRARFSVKHGLALLVVAVIVCTATWNRGELLKKIFIPGDPERAGEAVSGMVDTIRAGEAVKDAFVAFCLEIISNAEK